MVYNLFKILNSFDNQECRISEHDLIKSHRLVSHNTSDQTIMRVFKEAYSIFNYLLCKKIIFALHGGREFGLS
jgi:hypothetical protein